MNLAEILRLHGLWVRGAEGGARANFGGANLQSVNLEGANLWGADLRGADLRGANLRDASLHGADLHGADLRDADLHGADLRDASLRGANLHEADLRGADLRGAKNLGPLAAARLRITPDGELIAWKQCRGDVIVELRIPREAKRSNATGRKCRAEYAYVVAVHGAEVGVSHYDSRVRYSPGQTVYCDAWEPDRWDECAGGIHFFLTREEAEAYVN